MRLWCSSSILHRSNVPQAQVCPGRTLQRPNAPQAQLECASSIPNAAQAQSKCAPGASSTDHMCLRRSSNAHPGTSSTDQVHLRHNPSAIIAPQVCLTYASTTIPLPPITAIPPWSTQYYYNCYTITTTTTTLTSLHGKHFHIAVTTSPLHFTASSPPSSISLSLLPYAYRNCQELPTNMQREQLNHSCFIP
ncbi:hypothetical protein RHMOL_Rhmol01G0016100 [Rhododendron molle]|uniref:Uncharacterized protein n=1 Tax=Rhododendron molle TaxID=49168 RepID=A0ACC0PXL0_RHOML|nr:hypothetical protein RHMOL_Rhmol01G0016100 [Rhododendron molle]